MPTVEADPTSDPMSEADATAEAEVTEADGSQPAGFTNAVTWCMRNDSARAMGIRFGTEMYPQDYTLNGTLGGRGSLILLPGHEACSTGSSWVPGNMDVVAGITFSNGRETQFAVYNGSFQRPDFYPAYQGSSLDRSVAMSEGETREFDEHYNAWTVKRLADDGGKQFRIVFLGQTAPAAGSSEASASPTAAETDQPAGFGQRGVNVCVHNDSLRNVRVNWRLSDTNGGNGVVRPGGNNCGEGTFTWRASDVIVRVTYDDNLSTTLAFNNPRIGQPTVTQDPGTHSAAAACGIGDVSIGDIEAGFASDCSDSFGVGAIQTYAATRYNGLTVERMPDDGWKQFRITIKE